MRASWEWYEALGVERFHVRRTIRRQNDGEHTAGVMLLVRYLCAPELPSAALYDAALLHDLSEVKTGDLPAPVIRGSSAIQKEFRNIEDQWFKDMDITRPQLTTRERIILSIADSAECVMYCAQEVYMGNNGLRWILTECLKSVAEKHERLPRNDEWFDKLDGKLRALRMMVLQRVAGIDNDN